MKTCNKCKKRKLLAAFSKNGKLLHGTCKICRAESSREFYKNNREYYQEQKKEYKHSIHGYLISSYGYMKKRVEGRVSNKKYAHYWLGKPILPKEVFIEWSKNHPDFLRLFKRWTMAGHDQKLSPSVNRIDSNKGYTLDNIEWVTVSQNSSLAGAVRSFNKRKAVYALLGEKNV